MWTFSGYFCFFSSEMKTQWKERFMTGTVYTSPQKFCETWHFMAISWKLQGDKYWALCNVLCLKLFSAKWFIFQLNLEDHFEELGDIDKNIHHIFSNTFSNEFSVAFCQNSLNILTHSAGLHFQLVCNSYNLTGFYNAKFYVLQVTGPYKWPFVWHSRQSVFEKSTV